MSTSGSFIELNFSSQKLNDLLQLEIVDELIYRSTYTCKTRSVGIYGGQIISQAMAASDQTVATDRMIHSVHTYFILSAHENHIPNYTNSLKLGDNQKPVVYHVEKVRDGRSFTTRLVKAIQNGRHIFSCMLSYQKPEEFAYFHQIPMPKVAPPESLPLYEEVLKKTLKDNRVTDFQRAFISQYITEESLYFVKPVDDSWMSFFMEDMGRSDPEKQNLHRWLAGYISDSYLLQTALIKLPWGQFYPTMMCSLDHSLWFHCDFLIDDWMLYESLCPRYEGNRALIYGRMWKKDGALAVSMVQEGLLRVNSML
ncbi:hypothetical protein HELRODRAFT_177007 [Helobdella robusta]|uniref:Acyl-CoA thioesterase II domain-containing protein n=1 Tax=Helobdella robusta TaxID=6412 RepID=T1FB48_HELRO|nr:hypothetical protein HELRODRAFT_177007 [Helobdella robusta]ESN98527.1 hypothetical protein HELRODRAFT_177007 [Helobdella robusta]